MEMMMMRAKTKEARERSSRWEERVGYESGLEQ